MDLIAWMALAASSSSFAILGGLSVGHGDGGDTPNLTQGMGSLDKVGGRSAEGDGFNCLETSSPY
jgi:hypothetical protein